MLGFGSLSFSSVTDPRHALAEEGRSSGEGMGTDALWLSILCPAMGSRAVVLCWRSSRATTCREQYGHLGWDIPSAQAVVVTGEKITLTAQL